MGDELYSGFQPIPLKQCGLTQREAGSMIRLLFFVRLGDSLPVRSMKAQAQKHVASHRGCPKRRAFWTARAALHTMG